jgi:sugar/nucleoside kinase (ribokinase family)
MGAAGPIGLAVAAVAVSAAVTTTLIMKDREKRARKKEQRREAASEFQRQQVIRQQDKEEKASNTASVVAARRQVEATLEAIRALSRRVTTVAREALVVAARIGDWEAQRELEDLMEVVDVVVGSTSELSVADMTDAAEADAARIDLGRARAALEDARLATTAARTRLLDLEVQLAHDARRVEAAEAVAIEQAKLEELREANLNLRRRLDWERAQLDAELRASGA